MIMGKDYLLQAHLKEKAVHSSKDQLFVSFIEELYVSAVFTHSHVEDVMNAAELLYSLLPAFAKEPIVKILTHASSMSICAVTLNTPFVIDSIINEIKLLQMDLELVAYCNTEDKTIIHIVANKILDAESTNELALHLVKTLKCVIFSTDDWLAMKDAVCEATRSFDSSEKTTSSEAIEFGKWLADNNFIFLGSVEYVLKNQEIKIVESSIKGLLRSDLYTLNGDMTYQFLTISDDQVLIERSHKRSVVHRSTYMDIVVFKKFDGAGECVGALLCFGLFASSVYHQSVKDIPMIRHKIQQVFHEMKVSSVGDTSAALNILESFPRGELLQMETHEIFSAVLEMTRLNLIPKVKVLIRQDRTKRFASCLIFTPEKRFSTEVRLIIEGIISQNLDCVIAKRRIQVGEMELTRLHLLVMLNKTEIDVKQAASKIEAKILRIITNWDDDLLDGLKHNYSPQEAHNYFVEYRGAFEAKYRAQNSGMKAVHDIRFCEEAIREERTLFDIYVKPVLHDEQIHLKVYSPEREVALFSILPILENMGMVATDVETYHIEPAGGKLLYLSHFKLIVAHKSYDLKVTHQLCELLKEALIKIWGGKIDDDPFNALMLHCQLDYKQCNLLRAYARYLRQTRYPQSMVYTAGVLRMYPNIARKIVELFDAQFNPKLSLGSKQVSMDAIQIGREIRQELAKIESINEDRAIRSILSVVLATLRSNFYQLDVNGEQKDYISLKLDSGEIDDLPLPRPYAEIFVYSKDFEGIHLRGGPVARGGLRWSNRPEDFRTEVLGLMKAQMTKNSVIVPVGSKGGFIVKSNAKDLTKEEYINEGIRCYKMFLRGLLDITDNIILDEVVPPKHVVCLDGNDPYLVVAADTGTATFSDYANSVSAEYDFWLGDAFASGGSAGYDHKKMGITARGAWKSVLAHLKDMSVDIETTFITCVGIGDMSGDVFGNGMLMSRNIKLLAAFNHAHIFLDPDPDPNASFEERKRLFGIPRSQWSDYDTTLISKGGGVFERKAKSISLSKEVQEMLGLYQEIVSSDELLRAILKSKVDLLWNGGIGTYVKAASESNERVGDKANDAIRINGCEVGARIIGEGGNLGCTQLGRIEFALSGGKINTDFIDNSAGVDCSDHEVNIKIALSKMVRDSVMNVVGRNAILENLTEQVSELVLKDNHKQTQLISLEEHGGARLLNNHAWLIRYLEDRKELNRELEFLPNDNMLKVEKRALTRPEIAVLIAYAKNSACSMCRNIDFMDDPYLSRYLLSYFPQNLLREHPQAEEYLVTHPLRNQILSTVLINEFINMLGSTFLHQAVEGAGGNIKAVLKAFVFIKDVFKVDDAWSSVEGIPSDCDPESRFFLFDYIQNIIKRNISWTLLMYHEISALEEQIVLYSKKVQELSLVWEASATSVLRSELREEFAGLLLDKRLKPAATIVMDIRKLKSALDIAHIAEATGYDVEIAAKKFFECADLLTIRWLAMQGQRFSTRIYLQDFAIDTLLQELRFLHMQITIVSLQNPGYAVQALPSYPRYQKYIQEINDTDVNDAFVSKLTVALKYLRELSKGR